MDEIQWRNYIQMSKSGMSPEQLYATMIEDGQSKSDSCGVLRDAYSFGLKQCLAIAEKVKVNAPDAK